MNKLGEVVEGLRRASGKGVKLEGRMSPLRVKSPGGSYGGVERELQTISNHGGEEN